MPCAVASRNKGVPTSQGMQQKAGGVRFIQKARSVEGASAAGAHLAAARSAPDRHLAPGGGGAWCPSVGPFRRYMLDGSGQG